MSVTVMTWAWKQELPTGPKFVLIALADAANNDGLCYPGQMSLAKRCGMTDRTVRNAIKHLSDAGVITKSHRQNAKGKGRTSDLYQIMIPGAEPLNQPEDISALSEKDQQENISGSKPVDNSQNQPEEFSGKNATNRKIFPDQPEDISGTSIKNEPSVEPSVAETRARGDELANILGRYFPPTKVMHAKTIPMLRRWEREGITADMLESAIEIARAQLGETPGHPSYLAPIVQDLANPSPAKRVTGGNRQQAIEDHNRSAVQEWLQKEESIDA